MKRTIALQPHTIREELKQDYLGTLEKVAEIGYKGLEIGQPGHMPLSEFKGHLERLGLQVIGCHSNLDKLTNDLESVVNYLHEVGGRFVTVSNKFESRRSVSEKAERFNEIGRRCRESGIQFLYHNHNWEFERYDGEFAIDILLNETDPELVQMEPDVYWVKRGGVDPVEFLQKLKNRCPLVHIKDMEPGEEQFFAEIGEGILDFRRIAEAARDSGTEWLVVEQDRCRRPPLESIAISYRNLQKLELA